MYKTLLQGDQESYLIKEVTSNCFICYVTLEIGIYDTVGGECI